MYLLLDNYDSFTYNLLHYLQVLGADVDVVRNDALTVDEALQRGYQGIILSPGPCTPTDAGISLPLITAAIDAKLPLLGVCLGHQALGQAAGGKVIRAPEPLHGKTSDITHTKDALFHGIPSPFTVTRYHSLIVEKSSLPETLEITSETSDGLIMALRHKNAPLYGVQFHPESVASTFGHQLLANFLALSRGKAPETLTVQYPI